MSGRISLTAEQSGGRGAGGGTWEFPGPDQHSGS